VGEALLRYGQITAMWARASRAYPASFWMLMTGSFVITSIDFVAVIILFANIDNLGGFDFHEVAFLYGSSGIAIAVADLFVGQVERLGQLIRLGRLDQMMVRPVPLLVQVCAEEFPMRRLGRLTQAILVFAWACTYVEWSPERAFVATQMVLSGCAIFVSLFVALACIQFWTTESAEVANAFTYGGNAVTSYPLTIFPNEVVKALTFVVPIAFVNWYPGLYVLGREDATGYPVWALWLSPVVAALLVGLTALVWRTGVRQYRSTGS
jgi:ABC-2 type transport system permease protein